MCVLKAYRRTYQLASLRIHAYIHHTYIHSYIHLGQATKVGRLYNKLLPLKPLSLVNLFLFNSSWHFRKTQLCLSVYLVWCPHDRLWMWCDQPGPTAAAIASLPWWTVSPGTMSQMSTSYPKSLQSTTSSLLDALENASPCACLFLEAVHIS